MAEPHDRKPILTIEQQIEHLKQKGVAFELCSEEEAADYLRDKCNFFKLASYRKLFSKYEGGPRDGRYVDLDFGQLRLLAALDQELRHALLGMTLDIEHFQKVTLLREMEDRGEDGYAIVVDYMASLTTANREYRLRELKMSGRSPYSSSLYAKYSGDMPAWAFLELTSFGTLIDFVRFCARRWGDRRLEASHYDLKRVKSLSNVGAERLGDALGESIDDGAKLSIISSYFTVFAYGELKEELSKVDEVRFLFSEPTFIKRMADSKEPREFEVARRAREVGVGGSGLELTLRNNLNQRALARECAEWIREKGVFKSAKTSGAIQPGGTYVVENPSGDDHAFMGAAANFTQEGLGYERRPGTVTCVSHFENATEAVGLKMMFESVWDNPAMVEEVTAQVAAQVETLYRENPPEFIYFLTLYHLFRDFMEDDEDNGIRPGLKFEESVVWSKLYDFQKDAVVGAIRKLEKYKGCIIADSVGLGKTYEALAVMKYYQERNDRILVLCPKRLRDNWTLWTQDNDDRNPWTTTASATRCSTTPTCRATTA